MVDFKKLVEGLLVEQVAASSSDASYNFFAETKLSDGKTPYESFNTAYQAKYKRPALQNVKDLQVLLAAIRQSADKNQLTVEPFKNYVEAFPLVDFILYIVKEIANQPKALFNEFEKNIPSIKEAEKKKVVDKFINRFNTEVKENSWPLDYSAYTVQGRMLEAGLRKKLTENVVGDLALTKYLEDPKSSIYSAVYGLLAARKKVRDPLGIVPPANAFVNDILYGNINAYAGGGKLVQGKYARMYDKVSAEKLIELGNTIRKYYQNQVNRFAPEDFKGNKLEAFVKNELKDGKFVFEHKKMSPQEISFDKKFKLVIEELIVEAAAVNIDGKNYELEASSDGKMNIIDVETKQPVGAIDSEVYGKAKGAELTNLVRTAIKDASTDSENKPGIISSQSSDDSSSIPEGGYNIKNIDSQAKSGNEAAQELINTLKQFGDYIQEGEPTDWAGAISGATQVAKGLSLGT